MKISKWQRKFEANKLVIDQANKHMTLFMLVLGVQVSLTSAVFREAQHLMYACLAMLCMLLAAIAMGAVADLHVRMYMNKPKPNASMVSKFNAKTAFTPDAHSVFSIFCFFGSMVLYAKFLYLNFF